ncbi:hypothetical protein SKAU_G00140270 [Synaphobranchus kaupii]|uniref:trypsin n=1 Tax=Synaphobranchus kaupii TaxID=118154 RepID=A0A9Q1J3Y1_SYNKA|nr:hypothetical protein SKAU_G00140270 [Synaphobranchus kaupii]
MFDVDKVQMRPALTGKRCRFTAVPMDGTGKMVLTLLLCLCASFTPTSATILRGVRDLGVAAVCSPSPCLNGGSCITEFSRFSSFQCVCPAGYSGRFCQLDYAATEIPTVSEDENHDWLYDFFDVIDKCDPNPCQNNGRCESQGDTFKCICPVPFTGKKCQAVINFCRNMRCGNGECVMTTKPPYYECKCNAPFQPPTCIRASVCSPSPCLNGGACITEVSRFSTFQCVCPAGYSGRFCQLGTQDCFEGDGSTYDGLTSETEDGEDCLHWNSQFVLDKAANAITEYQEDERLGEHNYCRNPDGDTKPWCFVKRNGKLFWSYCKVRPCTGSSSGTVSPTVSEVPDEPADPVKPKPTSLTPAEFATCGKSQPSRFTPRIYGGKKSVPGAHPWQVSLQVRPPGFQTTFSHICGGTLIQPCWVLTAAHCITNPNAPMRVVLGRVDLFKDELTTQIVDVEQAIVHENYRETALSLHNDLALLKLKDVNGKCTSETKFVRTACLAEEQLPDATECTISGWGATPKSSYSRQLLDAKVLLIPQQRCSADSSYGSRLDDSMICAGHMRGGTDACQGDSGGPLVCEKNGIHFLYGVVSWGDSCGKMNKPGIYARVTKFTDWINSKIQA